MSQPAEPRVLVEDLLTLARLDEIAEAPHTSVDVAALAGDAVDDARAVAPERAIALSSSLDGGAVVLGDGRVLGGAAVLWQRVPLNCGWVGRAAVRGSGGGACVLPAARSLPRAGA